MKITIQSYLNGNWCDAAQLTFVEPERGRRGIVNMDYYDTAYVVEHLGEDGLPAVSQAMPIEFTTYRSKSWFSLIDDLMPAGASRRWWINALNLQGVRAEQQDLLLFEKGTIAPIGNLRVKESIEAIEKPAREFKAQEVRFQMRDVVNRTSDFLEYAQAMGAASGGATGAGGEAPKLLLRRTAEDQVWIDTFQDDPKNLDPHYLVKFPRGTRSETDCEILRAEYYYYHVLTEIGCNSINTEGMALIEGERYPSLWLPRFDVDTEGGVVQKHGMESVYSLMGKNPGDYLNHFDCIEQMIKALKNQYAVIEKGMVFDQEAFVIEWVKRDFLNVCFGNSDNHGRNTAVIKTKDGITLSPIYDFAPMRADPEGVTRTTLWGRAYEFSGICNWIEIAQALKGYIAPDKLISELRTTASQLEGLGEKLKAKGVANTIIQNPAVGLIYLDERLKSWELIK
jgi:serine/threonine-protein kinase HipA